MPATYVVKLGLASSWSDLNRLVTWTRVNSLFSSWSEVVNGKDVTADVRSIRIERGLSDQFGKMVSAEAEVTLNNKDGKYSPDNVNPYALSFDGVDDVVTTGDVWDFAGTAPFSVECWVKITVEHPADYRHILGKLTGAGDGWQIVKEPGLTIHFNRRLAANPNVTVSVGPVSLNIWNHVAFTFDGSNLRAYLNGVFVAGPTADSLSLPDTTANFKFGGSSNVPPAGCVLDEVRIWNVARTQTQIQDNMRRRLAGNESGLVGYWRIDEGSGTQAKDATANLNHGTITGATWTVDSSPLDGYGTLLRALMPISIEATSGVTKKRFTGFVMALELQTRLADSGEDERITVLRCLDLYRILRLKKATTGILTDKRFDEVAAAVLDAVGVTNRDLALTYESASFAMFTDEEALRALERIIEAGAYTHFIATDGRYTLKNRYWLLESASYKTYQAEMVDFRPVYDDADIVNAAMVRSQPREKAASLQVVSTLESVPLQLTAGASTTFGLDYFEPTTTGFERAPAVEMVTPVATTDYTANAAADGSGTDKTSQLTVTVTFFAERAEVTLKNNDSATIHVTKLELRGKPLRKLTPIARSAEDADSQAMFQRRDAVIENDLISSDPYAADYASYLVLQNKNMTPQATMMLRNNFPDLLEIDLGTVLTIVESVSGVNAPWTVEGYSELITAPGFMHEATYRLRKYEARSWLILDKDPEGILDQRRLGF